MIPPNIALVYSHWYASGVPSDVLKFSSHYLNISLYSLAPSKDQVCLPTFCYSRIETVDSFYVPECCDYTVGITVVKAVSSSVVSRNMLYSYAKCQLKDINSPVAPLNKEIGACIHYLELDLGSCNIPFDVVTFVFQFLPNLRVFNGNNLLVNIGSVDVLFKALASCCPKLRSIYFVPVFANDSVSKCAAAEDVWSSIGSYKDLEHLSIYSCFIPSPLLVSITPLSIPLHLRSLILSIHDVRLSNNIFSTLSIAQCLKILHLHISYAMPLNVELLLESCSKLEELT